MSDNTAILEGYTQEVMLYSDHADLHVFVKPDTDFDGRFRCYDADECEWIAVNGWLVGEIEEIAKWPS